MKAKLLKKIRKQYPIYFVENVDEDSNDLLKSLFNHFGPFYYTGSSVFDIISNSTKNGLIDDIMYKVRRQWYIKIKGRTQKIIKLN